MGWSALKWAMAQQTGDAGRKLVLLVLADHADLEGRCFPSLRTLVRRTELSKATVARRLAELERAGLIGRTKRIRDNGQQTSTGYVIHTGLSQAETGLSQGETGAVSAGDRGLSQAETPRSTQLKYAVEPEQKKPARTRGGSTSQHRPRRRASDLTPAAETATQLLAKVAVPRA